MKSFLGFASTATVVSLLAMAACGPADRRDGEDGDSDTDADTTDEPMLVDALSEEHQTISGKFEWI